MLTPLNPTFFYSKIGIYKVYIIFLTFAPKHRLRVLVRTASPSSSKEYPQFMFWAEIWKILEFFIWKFSVFGVKFSMFEWACFHNAQSAKC